MKLPDSIKVHHVVYLSIIFSILLLTLATWRLGTSADLVNQFGFASNLASLLLAVIAIIYSFISDSSLVSSINKIDSGTDKLNEVASNLSSINDILEKNFRTFTAQTVTLVSEMENRLTSEMTRRDENVIREIETLRERIAFQNQIESDTDTDTNVDISTFLKTVSPSTILLMFLMVAAFEKRKSIVLRDFSETIERYGAKELLTVGVVETLNALEIIQVGVSEEVPVDQPIFILSVNPILIREIKSLMSIIRNLIAESDEEYANLNKTITELLILVDSSLDEILE